MISAVGILAGALALSLDTVSRAALLLGLALGMR